MLALAYSLTRTIIFYVPMVWIASRIDGSITVYTAIAADNVLAGLVVAFESIRRIRRLAGSREGRKAVRCLSPGQRAPDERTIDEFLGLPAPTLLLSGAINPRICR